jgi:hypothetical protein
MPGPTSPLLLQLAATLAVLAWVPTNVGKLLAFVVVWALTFRRPTRAEWALVVAVCAFFTVMNAAALRQGIFAFSDPDALGMPVYEFLMWGFYVLHTRRLLDGRAPTDRRAVVWALALMYAVAFAVIPDPNLLLAVTATLLVSSLILFHEPHDLAYTGYMIVLGAAIEYTGVQSGQWHYPGDPPGGVPLWFVTLWGGVGLWLRRLALPMVEAGERTPTRIA